MSIVENLARISAKLISCGRENPPKLLAISKLKPAADVQVAFDAGQTLFGENYVKELVGKSKELPKEINWVFTGHLQSNKCRALLDVPNLLRINSVDSISLATKLNDICGELKRTVEVLVQVKYTDEESKSGINRDEVIGLVMYILTDCPSLIFRGLMTIGHISDHQKTVEAFYEMADLRLKLQKMCDKCPQELILSMGMSADMDEAIAAGSTEVRIGRDIFGSRTN